MCYVQALSLINNASDKRWSRAATIYGVRFDSSSTSPLEVALIITSSHYLIWSAPVGPTTHTTTQLFKVRVWVSLKCLNHFIRLLRKQEAAITYTGKVNKIQKNVMIKQFVLVSFILFYLYYFFLKVLLTS